MGGQNKQKSIFGLLHPPLTVAATTVAATTVAGRKRRGAIINTATTTLTKSELEQEERLAFTLCDSDRMAGLTWEEVLNCEVGRRWLASDWKKNFLFGSIRIWSTVLNV